MLLRKLNKKTALIISKKNWQFEYYILLPPQPKRSSITKKTEMDYIFWSKNSDETIHKLSQFQTRMKCSDFREGITKVLYRFIIASDADVVEWLIQQGADLTKPTGIFENALVCAENEYRLACSSGHGIDSAQHVLSIVKSHSL